MRALLAFTLIIMLSACGFHMRGAEQKGSLSFTQVSVEGDGIAVRNLRDYLGSYQGVTLINSGKAETVIRVLGEKYSKDVFSLKNSGRVAEYRLTYQIRFSAEHKGEEVLEETPLTLFRTLSWNEDAILSKEAEEATLIRDMQRDVTPLILRRVSASVKGYQ